MTASRSANQVVLITGVSSGIGGAAATLITGAEIPIDGGLDVEGRMPCRAGNPPQLLTGRYTPSELTIGRAHFTFAGT